MSRRRVENDRQVPVTEPRRATERLLSILEALSKRGVVSSQNVKLTAGYGDGESEERKFRRDKKILRDRGLIETDITTREIPNRKGMRRGRLRVKPPDLALTEEEHAAIWDVRERLRSYPGALTPYDGSGTSDLDLLMAMFRFLEERVDDCLVSEVAQGIGAEVPVVRRLVDDHLEFTGDGKAKTMLVPGVEDGADPDDPTVDWPVVSLEWGDVRNSRDRRRRAGLGQFGFFPYSRAEVEERLDLIGRGLELDGLDAGVKGALRTAEIKLGRWRDQLDRESMS